MKGSGWRLRVRRSDRVDSAVHDNEEREPALLEVDDVGAAVLCRDKKREYLLD